MSWNNSYSRAYGTRSDSGYDEDFTYGSAGKPSRGKRKSYGSSNRSKNAAPTAEDFSLEKGLAKAQRLLAARDRSSKEMLGRLEHDGFSHEVSSEVLARCVRSGLINDERFAEDFVEMKRAQGWGKRKIQNALEGHGISPAKVEQLLEEDPSSSCPQEESELDRATAYLSRHPAHSKDPYRSSMTRLLSRGFSHDVAREACRTLLEQASHGSADEDSSE